MSDPVFVNTPDQTQDMYGAGTQVNERIDTLQTFTEERWDETYQFIQEYQSFLQELEYPTADFGSIDLPTVLPMDITQRPQLGELDIDTTIPENNIPGIILSPPKEFTGINVPVISFTPPDWNTPDKPTLSPVTAPGEAPAISQTVLPTAPSITLPTAPTLSDITLPSAPSITLPEFEGTLPGDIGELTAGMIWEPSPYNSDIWSDLLAKVLNDIRNGGTGLSVEVEQELYDRALSRQQAENDRAYQEIENKMGSNGFDLPDGALTSALLQASAQISRNNSEINGQIMIDQSKLAQTNTHFMIEKGVQLEGILREFFHQSETRAFEAQKAIALVSVDVYNATVAKYNAKVEGYKAEAAVFEARTKAALTEIEIFKSQVEGARVSAEVQKNLVEIYNAQLGAVETQIKLYVSEMEGAKIHSQVEMSKIEVFKTQVQAYVARLEAEKVKFDIYATELQGEGVKAEVYKSQVQAYIAEVEGEKAKADIIVAEAEVILKNNSILIEEYKAKLGAYLAEIDFKSKGISAQVDGFRAEAGAYEAETGALGMYYGVKAKEMDVLISEAELKIQKAVAEIDATTKGYVAIKGLEATGHKGMVDVGAQLVSSAMNAINTNIGLSSSYSWSKGISQSTGSNVSETHTYEEKKI